MFSQIVTDYMSTLISEVVNFNYRFDLLGLRTFEDIKH